MIPAAIETNFTVTARDGTTLTADVTPHTEAASYTELIASTAAQTDVVDVCVSGVRTAGADTGVLLDLATGAAASETAFINDLNCGEVETGTVSRGNLYSVHRRFAASTRVSARIRATVASETAVVGIALRQSGVHIENVGAWTTYGANTAASQGTSVTAGSGAYGSWTEIATSSSAHNLFLLGLDTLGDTTVGSEAGYLVRFGYGATTGGGPHATDGAFTGAGGTIVSATWQWRMSTSEAVMGPFPPCPIYVVVGNSQTLWACIASGSAEARGVIIYGATGDVITAGGGVIGRGLNRAAAY